MTKYKITTKFIGLIIPLTLIMLMCACGNDNQVATEEQRLVPATLNISLAPGQEPVQGAKIDKVIVHVYGQYIEEPIERELIIDGIYATGMLRVPPGEVVLWVFAYAGERLFYEGNKHVVIELGRKVTVDIKLYSTYDTFEIPY